MLTGWLDLAAHRLAAVLSCFRNGQSLRLFFSLGPRSRPHLLARCHRVVADSAVLSTPRIHVPGTLLQILGTCGLHGAWRFLARLDIHDFPTTLPERISDFSLLGRREVHLRWRLPPPTRLPPSVAPESMAALMSWSQPSLGSREFRLIGSIPRLTYLDCSHRLNASLRDWTRLFELPSFKQLRTLIVADVVRKSGKNHPGSVCLQRDHILQAVHRLGALSQLLIVDFRRADSTSGMLLTRPQADRAWEMRLTRNTDIEVTHSILALPFGSIHRLIPFCTIAVEHWSCHGVRHFPQEWAVNIGSLAGVRELVLESGWAPGDLHLEIAQQFAEAVDCETVVTRVILPALNNPPA